jgi:hypothetical protein
VLFVIDIATRRVQIAGIEPEPWQLGAKTISRCLKEIFADEELAAETAV